MDSLASSMLLKKLQYKDKVTHCTPTRVSLGMQSNALYQFVYLHKLPSNSGSSNSEVSFHSLLGASSAILKVCKISRKKLMKKAISTARSTKHRKATQQATGFNLVVSAPFYPSPSL